MSLSRVEGQYKGLFVGNPCTRIAHYGKQWIAELFKCPIAICSSYPRPTIVPMIVSLNPNFHLESQQISRCVEIVPGSGDDVVLMGAALHRHVLK